MQLCYQDKARHQMGFLYPQFSTTLYDRVTRLLNLVTLDAGSLNYSYSTLATSCVYLAVSPELALSVSGKFISNQSCSLSQELNIVIMDMDIPRDLAGFTLFFPFSLRLHPTFIFPNWSLLFFFNPDANTVFESQSIKHTLKPCENLEEQHKLDRLIIWWYLCFTAHHAAGQTVQLLQKFDLRNFRPFAPYNPDLSPSDYNLFLHLKKWFQKYF